MEIHRSCRTILFGLTIFAGHAPAGPITVVNPDFEIVARAASDNLNPTITSGWVASIPSTAYFNPDDGDFDGATDGDATPTTLPDGGTYIAFVWDLNTITQTVPTPVTAGADYTLSYHAMDSGDFGWSNYAVTLRTTGGQTIISKTDADHTLPADKGFQFVEFTGTAPAGATGNLVIEFKSTVAGWDGSLPFFDNVGLSVANDPEPAAELKITSIALSGSTLTIEMEGLDGTDYWCASSTDLKNWTTAEETSLGSPFRTSGGTASFTIDTANRPSLFVRIQNFEPEPATAPTARVFLLGGQSNMAGVGTNSQLAPPYIAPQTDVRFWGGAFGTNHWVDLAPGFGNTASQFGPEISFGRALKDAYPNDDVYLIKYAVSGTALYNDWAPPSGPQYTNFVNTVAAALADLDTKGGDYQIAGMLWMQGESDALEGQGAAYETNLRNFIADMRTRFGEPDLPFLIGRITTYYGDATNNTAVRNAQVIVAGDTPHVEWFDTDGFSPGSPGSPADHYDTAGQIQLGQAFAASYVSQ
jgi:hypothetical protein